jgi:CBS domain-containing membrane protein
LLQIAAGGAFVTIKELMKRPVIAVRRGTSLAQARDAMVSAGIHHLPVVDADEVLIGVVSQRDVTRAIDIMTAANGLRQSLTIGDIMTTDVLRVGPDLPAHEAAAMMIEAKIGSLPVVGDDGRVVGVVTATDFLEVAREALLGVSPERRAHA